MSANQQIDWQLASARVVVSNDSLRRVKAVKKIAKKAFWPNGGYDVWKTINRPDERAFDIAFGDISFERVSEGGLDGLRLIPSLLPNERSEVRYVYFKITQLEHFEWMNFEVWRWKGFFNVIVNFLRLDHSRTSVDADALQIECMNKLNFRNEYVQGVIGGKRTDFVLKRAEMISASNKEVKYRFGDKEFLVNFQSADLRVPQCPQFFYSDDEYGQFVDAAEECFKLLGQYPKQCLIRDRPIGQRQNPLPPPEGAWSISAWAGYKKGFDPFKRPERLISSVRYPLFQMTSDDFNRLLWQIDVVHTLDESFFDVQTSEGPHHLEEILKEFEIEGEVWQGDFAGRWNIPPDDNQLGHKLDRAATQKLLDEIPEYTLSSLDRQQIQIAESYVISLTRMRNPGTDASSPELDYSVASLEALDRYISIQFPDGCLFETTVLGVAAYVGEVIRRNQLGSWTMTSELPAGVSVEDSYANVLSWARKRFSTDQRESLAAKYAVFVNHLKNKRATSET